MAGMTRFSPSAQRALHLANVEAVQLNHHQIEPGHILLGLLQVDAPAGKILAEQGADLETIRRMVDQQIPDSEKGEVKSGSLSSSGSLSLSKSTQTLLEQVARLVRQYKHGEITIEHLLLALIELDDPSTQSILVEAGLEREVIRAQVQQYLAASRSSLELHGLLTTLHKLREILKEELTPADASHLDRIEAILREYFKE